MIGTSFYRWYNAVCGSKQYGTAIYRPRRHKFKRSGITKRRK